ncbi:hypothetical protein [Haloarcula sediminis]|nr:hypothetical protein [Haloarcula sp. CK38]
MSAEAVTATCKNCGYTDDCDEVTSNVGYECDYCGGNNWDTTDCE